MDQNTIYGKWHSSAQGGGRKINKNSTSRSSNEMEGVLHRRKKKEFFWRDPKDDNGKKNTQMKQTERD